MHLGFTNPGASKCNELTVFRYVFVVLKQVGYVRGG